MSIHTPKQSLDKALEPITLYATLHRVPAGGYEQFTF